MDNDDLDTLRATIQRLHEDEMKNLKRINSSLFEQLQKNRFAYNVFIAESDILKQLLEKTELLAKQELPLLILGQKGVGKTQLARYIHLKSTHHKQLLSEVDCSQFNSKSLAGEIFGTASNICHEKLRRCGAIELAQGGTLLLQRIENIPDHIQIRIAESIESHCYRNEMGTIEHPVNARIIITADVSSDELRSQSIIHNRLIKLFHTGILEIPQLAEHKEDLRPLVLHFIKQKNSSNDILIEPDVEKILLAYNWPGNVEELKIVIENCMMRASTDILDKEIVVSVLGANRDINQNEKSSVEMNLNSTTDLTLRHIRLDHIRRVLKSVNGHRRKASQVLGITTRTLSDVVKEIFNKNPT